ncbi:beta-galactosidase-like [Dendronephthya gigantea]|uniref:beta-galactosidase-like n=1 Tax=Dendronephthya gigantea TaxID=151771 RepID=UPI00106D488F|nr:beta-galactosidase-like [Dendronephthya gigantea]
MLRFNFVIISLNVFACSSGAFFNQRSFTIDYENNVFLKDGKPFQYISGGIHYFRIPRVYWKDRLMKMKAAGLNTVQTYVAWNFHEPRQGQYNFNNDSDIEFFVKLVNSLELLLILRPGPYICAEWDLGGLPSWLLRNSSMVLRSSDHAYLSAVTSWMNVLLPKLKPYLYANGGPIIAVQVENEYGSYYTCDHNYMRYLQDLFQKHLSDDVILFTVDPIGLKSDINCGTLSSLFTTIDFGPETDPEVALKTLRKYQPNGPMVNTEFYVGWIDNWGLPFQRKNATIISTALDKLLSMNASVNIYMFEGGSNFGFNNGATWALLYLPVLTSYDYDAPLSEAGDPTEKYFSLRNVISKYSPQPPGPVPPALPKHGYGKVYLKKLLSVWDVLKVLPSCKPIISEYPVTAEQISQVHGFTIYRTQLRQKSGSSLLNIPGVRDRATIFLNQEKQGVLDRNGLGSIGIEFKENDILDILVENQGHINFMLLNDPKGVIQNVTLHDAVLTNWTIFPLSLDPDDVAIILNKSDQVGSPSGPSEPASFYVGDIPAMPDGKAPLDTFLYLKNWSKGQAFVNTFNLGRYWPAKGPQQTLYVPSSALNGNPDFINKIILFEIDEAPCFNSEYCYVEFIKNPILGKTKN